MFSCKLFAIDSDVVNVDTCCGRKFHFEILCDAREVENVGVVGNLNVLCGQGIVVFVQQVAGVRDTETVAGGIVNRKTYGGGRVGKHHLANPQFAACRIQASQRIRVLHNASGADGNGHGKEAAQENHRQLSHECVNVFIVI